MKKSHKIIYWVSTLWLSLGMFSTGLVQLMQREEDVKFILDLGYPAYFLTILGVWKLLGVVAVLIPGRAILKEWAYAGFFFTTTGALYSHFAVGGTFGDAAPSLLLLVLTVTSWYFRPIERRVMAPSSNSI